MKAAIHSGKNVAHNGEESKVRSTEAMAPRRDDAGSCETSAGLDMVRGNHRQRRINKSAAATEKPLTESAV